MMGKATRRGEAPDEETTLTETVKKKRGEASPSAEVGREE